MVANPRCWNLSEEVRWENLILTTKMTDVPELKTFYLPKWCKIPPYFRYDNYWYSPLRRICSSPGMVPERIRWQKSRRGTEPGKPEIGMCCCWLWCRCCSLLKVKPIFKIRQLLVKPHLILRFLKVLFELITMRTWFSLMWVEPIEIVVST